MSVNIDLNQLREMHTKLPTDLVLSMVGQAAMALERNGHTPGVGISLDLEQILSSGSLSWPQVDMSKIDQHARTGFLKMRREMKLLSRLVGSTEVTSLLGFPRS